MRAGDRRARDELIAMHLPFARALALRYRRRGEPIDDLAQVAALGLMKAIDRWDPERGVELTTYATPTILGELLHHLRDHTWGIRPPRRLQELSLTLERARDALRTELGRSPTVGELARRLERAEEEVIEALQAGGARVLASLDAPVEDGTEVIASVGEQIASVDHELERAEDRVTLERLTRVLDDRAREIVRLRFEEDMLQSEIAARVGWSQMHVSRIVRASLDRLHAYATAARPAALGTGSTR